MFTRKEAAISRVFRVAVEDETLPFNSAARIRRLREDNQRTRFLSPDEEEKLTAVIRRRFPNYLPVFQLALHTGMRTSELLRASATTTRRQAKCSSGRRR